MQIDERGKVYDPEVVSGEASDQCRKTLMEFAKHAKYMPALHQGNPVEVKFVDFWFRSPDRWAAK
jgi:hypothetical protein